MTSRIPSFEVINRRAYMLGACAIRARQVFKNSPRYLMLFLEAIQRHASNFSTRMEDVVTAEKMLQGESAERVAEISNSIFDILRTELPPQGEETLRPGELEIIPETVTPAPPVVTESKPVESTKPLPEPPPELESTPKIIRRRRSSAPETPEVKPTRRRRTETSEPTRRGRRRSKG